MEEYIILRVKFFFRQRFLKHDKNAPLERDINDVRKKSDRSKHSHLHGDDQYRVRVAFNKSSSTFSLERKVENMVKIWIQFDISMNIGWQIWQWQDEHDYY